MTNTLSVTLILVTNTVDNKVIKLKTHNCLICVSPKVVPNIVFISNVPLVNFSEGRLGRIGGDIHEVAYEITDCNHPACYDPWMH